MAKIPVSVNIYTPMIIFDICMSVWVDEECFSFIQNVHKLHYDCVLDETKDIMWRKNKTIHTPDDG